MEEELGNSDYWVSKKGVTVLDPDGWDRRNFEESWNELITEREFELRFAQSTVMIPLR